MWAAFRPETQYLNNDFRIQCFNCMLYSGAGWQTTHEWQRRRRHPSSPTGQAYHYLLNDGVPLLMTVMICKRAAVSWAELWFVLACCQTMSELLLQLRMKHAGLWSSAKETSAAEHGISCHLKVKTRSFLSVCLLNYSHGCTDYPIFVWFHQWKVLINLHFPLKNYPFLH